MKKCVKPEAYYENFQLNQSIAACGWDMNSQTKETCQALSDPEIVGGSTAGDMGILFVSENQGCVVTDWEAYCYQPGSGSESMKVFMS